jgi:hypothetical protein
MSKKTNVEDLTGAIVRARVGLAHEAQRVDRAPAPAAPKYIPRPAHATVGRVPAVEMSKPAAEALAGALARARVRLVREAQRVERARNMPEAEKRNTLAALRADLVTLGAFHAAHEEAHGLGGY